MGGRGSTVDDKPKKKPDRIDPWAWLKEVSDKRLKNYVKRANYIQGDDPQGRNIHGVAERANRELYIRGVNKL